MKKARIFITPKKGILDPQGKAIRLGLENLGYKDVDSVKAGKILEVDIQTDDDEYAKKSIKDMCDRLLANPNMEDYTFEILEEKIKII